ncbi:MAG: beta-lactamase family protein [Acidobacteria bacterium]|nr:beta-lactamase family protein [Acidobacteriota bacterium]
MTDSRARSEDTDSTPSALGGSFDLQDFYRGFRLDEITPTNMQSWPFYKYVSARWPRYVTTSSQPIRAASTPAGVEEGERFDLNAEFRDGKTYLQSLIDTQVKGFVVLRNNRILAEFYDNGFNVGDQNLLQSSSKTLAGVLIHKLLEAGLLEADATVTSMLPAFDGTTIGPATIQQVLDMMSGARTLLDFHTPGTPDQQWEVEIGLQAGVSIGHLESLRGAGKACEPGTAWNYTDMNTDVLGLVAELASGRTFAELLEALFDDFGSIDGGSIALTSDGTSSPCYGISMSTRDYALFHQWIAQRKAPASYYASAMDISKDMITTTNDIAATIFSGTTYGSQSYYMTSDDVLHSSGSYGQLAMSDMQSGVAVAVHSDWANNAEQGKFAEARERAVSIIAALR